MTLRDAFVVFLLMAAIIILPFELFYILLSVQNHIILYGIGVAAGFTTGRYWQLTEDDNK